MVSSFIGGFVVALVQGWQLTLVMLSIIPPMVLAAALMATVLTKMAAHGQTAYSESAATVEQTIGSIRTVGIFCLMHVIVETQSITFSSKLTRSSL